MESLTTIKKYRNKTDAWNDWRQVAAEVEAAGYGNLVDKFQPPESASSRRIAICVAALREAYQSAQRLPAPIRWSCPECGSSNLEQERMPYGPMWCKDCGFYVKDKTAIDNPFKETGEQPIVGI
ncbi:MAG: hypothetical protein JW934_05950 [Anaerolineae bacterium]|nr:hypothetical protein [Anaerolineae bacterium]